MNVYLAAVGVVGFSALLADIFRSHQSTFAPRPFRALPAAAKLYVWIAAFTLIFVAAFRWMVGTDYLQYFFNYPMYRDTLGESIRQYNEPGIRFLAYVASLIHDDPVTMFVLASIMTVGLIMRTLAKSGAPLAFCFLIYIFVGTWHESFNIVRQSIAIAIVFAGHQFILERTFKKYLLVVLFASLFHVSALLTLLLYWVPRHRFRLRGLAVLLGLALAALVSSETVLSSIVSWTEAGQSYYTTREVSPMRLVIALAPLPLYVVAVARSGDKTDPVQWYYRNMALVYAAVVAVSLASAYLFRFTLYVGVFTPLVLAALTRFKNPQMRHGTRAIIVSLYALAWYLEISSSSALVPYTWAWDRW